MKSTWHKNSQHETVESQRRKKKHSAQAVVVCTVHITGANSLYIIIAIVSLSFAYCVCLWLCLCAQMSHRAQKHITHSSRTPHILKCLLNGEMETKRRRNAINYNFFDFNSLDSLIYHAVWFGMVVVVVHGKTSIGPAR